MTTVLEALREQFGAALVEDPQIMLTYSVDQAVLAPSGAPLAVVRARDIADVVATLQIASAHGVPVVPRGAGSGLAGGANAIDGSIVLSTSSLNQVIDIDPMGRTATVQPGVINGDLDAAARSHGLRYAPDPGSRAICTLGGNLATNAGGMCCSKYGGTADHVLSAKAVLADGRIIEVGSGPYRSVAGLDLLRLMIGSEGTLGVFVEATVKLLPSPTELSTVVACFAEVDHAVTAAIELCQHQTPAVLELMDRTTVAAVDGLMKLGLGGATGALLIVQYDDGSAAANARQCVSVCTEAGATEVFETDDRDEGHGFLESRRMALPALERGGTTFLDDVAVPVRRMGELVRQIELIAKAHDVVIGTFGHAASGNLHPTIVFDASSDDASDRAHRAFNDITMAALALGGSITGEHGVGALKIDYMASMLGPVERELMAGIKRVFDPAGILNPGRGY